MQQKFSLLKSVLINNNNNNNNNNKNHDNFFGAITLRHNRFKGAIHSVDLTNAGLRQAAANLQTKLTNLGCESACRLQALHPPLPLLLLSPIADTQSFYSPAEGGRLSQHAALYNVIQDYIAHGCEKLAQGFYTALMCLFIMLCQYYGRTYNHSTPQAINLMQIAKLAELPVNGHFSSQQYYWNVYR